ncbi:NAD-dependent epimerase/dehydratase family protein [Kineococcus sp. NBC_00420]|uniref:NAD-dependent epimerase/dehydratase family protein n=1 Tax=Kineococcus sp. NBC_00420 TaxID=2903564 RepID=UPI002E1EA38A
MRALITGATGYVGSRLVPALLDAGFDVLAGARDPGKLAAFDTSPGGSPPEGTSPGSSTQESTASSGLALSRIATSVELDVMDADSCARALSGHGQVDVAYYLVHGLGEGDFAETDLVGARTFASAAAAAGVRRIVYLGGLVPPGQELSEHLESRRVVGETLREFGRGVDLVWLRAAIVLGAGSTSFELIRHLVDRLPVIPVPVWMEHRVQPIAVDDVVHYLRHSAEADVPAGAYDIGGPDALPYRDLVATYARVSGRRRFLLPVRGVSTALAARVIGWVVPLPSPLVADLVDSLSNTMVVTEETIRRFVPSPPGGVTGVREALRRCATPAGVAVVGPGASADALRLNDTDPEWAG